MKTWGKECAVPWCVCLVKPECPYCTVHSVKGKDFKPADVVSAATGCDDCEGTGECADCYGHGTHVCGHENCDEEHECGSCDGSGECSECGTSPEKDEASTFDERYIAFAFDPGWIPPVAYDSPWEAA